MVEVPADRVQRALDRVRMLLVGAFLAYTVLTAFFIGFIAWGVGTASEFLLVLVPVFLPSLALGGVALLLRRAAGKMAGRIAGGSDPVAEAGRLVLALWIVAAASVLVHLVNFGFANVGFFLRLDYVLGTACLVAAAIMLQASRQTPLLVPLQAPQEHTGVQWNCRRCGTLLRTMPPPDLVCGRCQ